MSNFFLFIFKWCPERKLRKIKIKKNYSDFLILSKWYKNFLIFYFLNRVRGEVIEVNKDNCERFWRLPLQDLNSRLRTLLTKVDIGIGKSYCRHHAKWHLSASFQDRRCYYSSIRTNIYIDFSQLLMLQHTPIIAPYCSIYNLDKIWWVKT